MLKTGDVNFTYDGQLGILLVAYSELTDQATAMMLMLCGAPVVWRSTFQKTVALSSTEAEYMAVSEYVAEVVRMHYLLKDIGAEQA